MAGDERSGTDWSDGEIDLIVADYFDMLTLEMARRPYVKAHRNAALQAITGRSRGSIEFKHQNISAVLRILGRPWINGYKPMANFQKALQDSIERRLDAGADPLLAVPARPPLALAEAATLLVEAPPQLLAADSGAPAEMQRLIRKFDAAARDARNRSLGAQGEEMVFEFEKARLATLGRSDLARRVQWVSQELGDGAGYDIRSYDEAGGERLLEVKTTAGHQTTPFYLSENERLLAVERPAEFRLVRLYDFARAPRAFELAPPLEHAVMLRPVSYRASFGRGAAP